MRNGMKFLIGLCAVSFSAVAQFFPIPTDVVPYGDNRRSLKGSSVDFRFSDSTKQLLVGLTATAAQPAYSFPGTGNNDNGMYRSGTDQISLVTAGQNRLTIGATGIISFGTSITPFVVRTGDTMTGGLTVLSGVTADLFVGPFVTVGPVTANVVGSASLNVLKSGDTMTGPLRVTDSSFTSIFSSGSIKAAQDLFAGQVGLGTGGKLRILCDSGSECWRIGMAGSGGATDFDFRSLPLNAAVLSVSTAGIVNVLVAAASTSKDTGALVVSDGGLGVEGNINAGGMVSASGGTMTGLLGVGTLTYIGSTSGDIKFRAPAVAGSQSYVWPSSQQLSNSYLVGISSGVMLWQPISNSEVFVQSSTAYGSTATKVRRWTNLLLSTGPAITFDQSTVSGDRFTANEDGTYAMTYCDQFSAVANMGISINASAGTTSVQSLTNTEVACGSVTSGANIGGCCSATMSLSAGAIIRAQTDGTGHGSNNWMQSFRIRKLGP